MTASFSVIIFLVILLTSGIFEAPQTTQVASASISSPGTRFSGGVGPYGWY
jgi:hypothetical protein